MKKIFAIFTVVVLTTTMSFSQNDEGTFAIGGEIDDRAWTSWSVAPSVGYFINDGFEVGAGFEMETGDASSKTTSISPYVRYYFSDNLFVRGGIGSVSTTSTVLEEVQTLVYDNFGNVIDVITTFEDKEETDTDIQIRLSAGLSLMWNDRVAIEPALNLTSEEDKLSLGIGIGISFRLAMDE